MSSTVEAPHPDVLIEELRDEARVLPKDPTDPMLSQTRSYLAAWIRSLHNRKDLGGLWRASRDAYHRENTMRARGYSVRKLETSALQGRRG